MLRYFLSITILFIASKYVYATPLNDTSQNKSIDRIVSGIAAKCQLTDSTKKELSAYFFSYYLKIKKIRNDPKKEMSCFGDLSSLKNDFLDALKKKFGEDVYKYYKKITIGCTYYSRRKMQNRITERTSE